MPANDNSVGRRILRLRKALGLSQSDLAQKIGVRFQQVQKYENGKNVVPACRLGHIADALGVSVLTLLRDQDTIAQGNDDCAELMDLFMRLPSPQRAEVLFQLRAKSARLVAKSLACQKSA